MADDRTEQPTSRRLRDARKKGQVARSRDAGQVAALVAVLVTFTYAGSRMLQDTTAVLTGGLRALGSPTGDLTSAGVGAIAQSSLLALVRTVGPLALASAAAVVLVQGMQGGWLIASEALSMNWNRLNPASGVKRLTGAQGGADALKALIVTLALGLLAWGALQSLVLDAPRLVHLPVGQSASVVWDTATLLLKRCAVLLALVALADYGLQRWRHLRGLRMTKQEVREDARLTEGNPESKSRVRRIQREMARRRMMADVPRATVVITNPTHVAVALEYRRHEMAAPRVLAKGGNLVAERIKTLAREHGIPVVENVPLARALFRTAEVGDLIPAELFDAVAEVLAYLIRLRRLSL